MPIDDPNSGIDARYDALPRDLLPRAECLKDVLERMLPWWDDAIVPDLRTGATVLVAAHGNSLRALVKHLDGMTPEEVVELNLPTGEPLVYELDDALQPDRGPGPGRAARAVPRPRSRAGRGRGRGQASRLTSPAPGGIAHRSPPGGRRDLP